ncbi:MarR family winged helix-turn-helix transcriptional regulator [Streptomyces sp. NPDC005533]|uniref:MarR family winged helix-turn-helix transcriptional regulator n=1 Tax=Streptomyces sp. NPDC005533 TaxID=3364723 RepID=UPI0036BDF410
MGGASAEGQTQSRWQLLSVASEEPLTVARVARRLGVARQGVQRVANDLVREELAWFAPNPDHRGSPLLTLTPTGQDTLRRITTRASAIHRALTADIATPDIVATRGLLHRLIDEVHRYEDDDHRPTEDGSSA